MCKGNSLESADRDGFTLIELLVVIVIIGILAGMLIPTLVGVVRRGEDLECRSNLKEIARSVLKYTTDYKGTIPPTKIWSSTGQGEGQALYWCNLLARRGIPAQNAAHLGAREKSSQSSILLCPNSTETLVSQTTQFTAPDDEAAQGWYRLGNDEYKTDCSYYWNGYVGTDPDKRRRFPSLSVDLAKPREIDFHNISEIPHRSHFAMIMDGVLFQQGDTPMPQRIAARHGGMYGNRRATNIAYYDGHVDAFDRYAPEGTGDSHDWSRERPASNADDELSIENWQTWEFKPIMSRATVLGEDKEFEGGPPEFLIPKR